MAGVMLLAGFALNQHDEAGTLLSAQDTAVRNVMGKGWPVTVTAAVVTAPVRFTEGVLTASGPSPQAVDAANPAASQSIAAVGRTLVSGARRSLLSRFIMCMGA